MEQIMNQSHLINCSYGYSTRGNTQVSHRQTAQLALKNVGQNLNVTYLPNRDNLTFPHIYLQTSKSL